MSLSRNLFSQLQKVGKALMLPVSILPVAGLFLGLGSAEFSWMPELLSSIMAQSGAVIFSNIPLVFAVGVALGFTQNDGVAGLAAVVAYVVLLATMGVFATTFGVETKSIMGISSIETGIFGGILVGACAALIFNRYYNLRLPPYLAFFAGKRSVPIISAFVALILGLVLSVVWPPVGLAINAFSHWAASENPLLAFSLYGFVERLLIPFGLHHIWNAPFFFEVGQFVSPNTGKVLTGEIARYIGGDPTAGNMTGGYLFKMWGLPAAAFAIWYRAKPENKKRVLGLMASGALTSFLTGITEPIEFSFLFLAPLLYGLHALLASAAYGLCILLGIKHGMTFSHGLIDYVILFPQSKDALWLFLIGPLWALGYFVIFSWAIQRFDLRTPGREDSIGVVAATEDAANESSHQQKAMAIIKALGGKENIKSLDACITRLRVQVVRQDKVNNDDLRSLGASGVVKVGEGVQAIFGTESENIKTDMDAILKTAQQGTEPQIAKKSLVLKPDWVVALGGQDNIKASEACAGNRIRVELKDLSLVVDEALEKLGLRGVARLKGNVFHLLVP